MGNDQDVATVILPEDIQGLQASLTKSNLNTFPIELTSSAFPYWLLWAPTPNNLTNQRKPCTKLLKKPTNPQWQLPSETLPFDKIHKIYDTKIQRYTECLALLKNNPRQMVPIPVGFGFVYVADHPFICIDIDGATEENEALVNVLSSYTEWSPSNNGLHVIVRAEDIKAKQHLIKRYTKGKRRLDVARDLFIASGYVTITGNRAPIAPTEVRTVETNELIRIFDTYFMPTNVIKHPSLVEQEQERADAVTEARLQGLSDKKVKWDAPTVDPEEVPKGKPALDKSPLKGTQIKNMLFAVPVKCLESDIFDRLFNDNLAIIDRDCEEEAREPWLIVGQAIHHNFSGNLQGFSLWNDWSKEGDKYDEEACESTWRSFKDLPDGQKPVTIGALIKLVNAQRPQFPDTTSKGQLKGTLDNFQCYVDFYKIKCTRNEISKDAEVFPPEYVLKKWHANNIPSGEVLSLGEFSELISKDFIKFGFPPNSYSSASIKKLLAIQCRQHMHNPIRDYFTECGEKWDKKDRISLLAETITVDPRFLQFTSSIHAFIHKWLIQVAAAACHSHAHSVRLNRVLIFTGPQNIGKTKWVESLFPKDLRRYCVGDKELRITNFRTDNVKQSMELNQLLICNINEIDRLFRGNNFSDFKAFLDQTTDRLVLPYGEAATEMTRRTVFIGSTNKESFLQDITGNRRFEIIPTIKLDWKHVVDIEQLWGQVYNLYKEGEKWWFNEDDPTEAQVISDCEIINSRSMYIGDEAFLEQLDRIFDADHGGKWQKMTFAQVRTITGMSDLVVNSKAFNQAKRALLLWSKEVSGKDTLLGKGTRPCVWYYMPPLRDGPDPVPPEPDDDEEAPPDERKALVKQMKLLQMQLNKINKKENLL